MSCDVGEVTEILENEQSLFSKLSITSPMSQLILIIQAFRHFTYVTAHSPTLPSLYLRHNSFYNPSVASPTSPGEPPMPQNRVPIHKGTTFMYLHYSPPHYHLLPNVWKSPYTISASNFVKFLINRPIAWKSSSLVLDWVPRGSFTLAKRSPSHGLNFG